MSVSVSFILDWFNFLRYGQEDYGTALNDANRTTEASIYFGASAAQQRQAKIDDTSYSASGIAGAGLGGLQSLVGGSADGFGYSINDIATTQANNGKSYFGNVPRPFTYTGAPPPRVSASGSSLPSGHTTKDYANSLYLAYMFPERFQQILARASDYANNRIVNGVHFPMDIIAGRMLGTATFADTLTYDAGNIAKLAASLRASAISNGGGQSIQAIANNGAGSFNDLADDKAQYEYRLTYNLVPDSALSHAEMSAAEVPADAQLLLATRLPYLTADQRSEVIRTTALPGGIVGDNGDAGNGWARIDLFSAASGYGAIDTDTTVTMNIADAADDTKPGAGFNAADIWSNDIGGSAILGKAGTGALTLSGNDSFGGVNLVDGTLTLSGTDTFSASSTVTGGRLVLDGNSMTQKGSLTLASGAALELRSATLTINGTLGNTGSISLDHATLHTHDVAGTGAIVLGIDSVLDLESSAASSGGQSIEFVGDEAADGTLFLADDAAVARITGFDAGDRLELAATSGTLSYNSDTGLLTVAPTDATSDYVLDVGTGYDAAGFSIAAGTFSGQSVEEIAYDESTPCYCAGTLIRTPSGEVLVESLAIGDEVLVHDWRNNRDVARPLVWVGRQMTVFRPELPDDEAGYPVRVLRDAIAENVPHKDLLVTPEHCLFFNGDFVPARMLVNGRSVFFDRSMTSYMVFHIETEAHSIVWADGMPAESYLDTGNRRGFAQVGPVTTLVERRRDWATDAGAPLTVSQEVVEPLFRALQDRATVLGLPNRVPPVALTGDADLHLLCDRNQVIRSLREANGRTIFRIPPGVTAVRLMSRTSRPSDVIGPFVDDRRQLGVLVGEVTLQESDAPRPLDAHLVQADLPGWDVVESAPCRWTRGDALLPLGQRRPNCLGLLSVHVLAAGPYLLAPKSETADTRGQSQRI